jgi:hypothetical protein
MQRVAHDEYGHFSRKLWGPETLKWDFARLVFARSGFNAKGKGAETRRGKGILAAVEF